MLPGAFAERYLRTIPAPLSLSYSSTVRLGTSRCSGGKELEFLTRCCINFLFIRFGVMVQRSFSSASPEKAVAALSRLFVPYSTNGAEPVRDNRSRTGSKCKQADFGAPRASIFSAATRSFMDMIVVGTTSSAVLLCLMIAKYHTDVVAITPDQSASLGGLKSIKGQQKVHR